MSKGTRGKRRSTAKRIACALVAMLAACADPAPLEPERPPNILVYMIDTLRAPELGTYGSTITHTPVIDALARDSTLFERAKAPTPTTRYSIASLLAGVPPEVHGVEQASGVLPAGPSPLAWLPELLREEGYWTAAVVANPNVDAIFGFDRGFDTFVGLYEERSDLRIGRPRDLTHTAPAVIRRALEVIDAAPQGRPFFLFVLSIDPHGPFTPPAPWDTHYDPRLAGAGAGRLASLRIFDRRQRAGEPVDVDKLLALYRGEISFADASLAELLDGLRARHLLDETLFALTADHGEEFLEHGLRGHGRTIHEETVHIPLLMRHPGHFEAGHRRGDPVDLLDLGATLAWMGGASPPDYWPGRDLRGELTPRAIFGSSRNTPEHHYASVERDGFKRIENERTGEALLFDLRDDPREQKPLDESAHAERSAALGAELASFRRESAALRERLIGAGAAAIPEEELPADIRARLESLGYIEESISPPHTP